MTNERDYDAERADHAARRLHAQHGMSRRHLLAAAAAGVPLFAGSAVLTRGPSARADDVPIRKPLPPEWFIDHGTNAEMRWEAMSDQGEITPVERFFVRNHTSTPTIDPATWRMEVFGSGVDKPREFTLDDLVRMPSTDITAFIECAGNGRSYFGSQQGAPAPGTPWKLGAIGVARWRGVPLCEVLDRAGLRTDAVDVLPTGLDPRYVSGGTDHGHMRRPLPITKALDDVVLAYEMNGCQLPVDHGFPVRLVVPGWVGVASIKWVGSLEVANEPLFSPWNTTMYRMIGPDYPPDSPPLAEQQAKSAFELAWGAEIPQADRITLHGRSWSGHKPVRHVEVSVDGGASWERAPIRGPHRPDGWVRWSFRWRDAERGEHELLARATDSSGLTQPDAVPFNQFGYQFWAVVRHPVTVV